MLNPAIATLNIVAYASHCVLKAASAFITSILLVINCNAFVHCRYQWTVIVNALGTKQTIITVWRKSWWYASRLELVLVSRTDCLGFSNMQPFFFFKSAHRHCSKFENCFKWELWFSQMWHHYWHPTSLQLYLPELSELSTNQTDSYLLD